MGHRVADSGSLQSTHDRADADERVEAGATASPADDIAADGERRPLQRR